MYSYYVYYKEIKNRFFLVLISWIFTLFVCYFYKETILSQIISYSNISSSLYPTVTHFIFTDITEVFYVYAQLILFVSSQFFIHILFYHIFMFFSPGLYTFEYKKLLIFFKLFIFSFMFSLILLNNLLMPISFDFFLSFQQQVLKNKFVSLFFEAKLVEFFSFYKSLYYVSLFNCQFIILLSLVINRLSYKLNNISKFRRIFYYIFVIFSTLTTPPDVFSQLFVSFSIILIYELSIFFSFLIKFSKATN